MKLHANAALSLNQRRRMVCRVVEQGWSLTEAAEAAEVSERTCSKWVGSYRAEEVGAGHPLHDLLTDAHVTGSTTLRLEGLQASEVAELVAARAPYADDEHIEAFSRRIHDESAGSPLFACELRTDRRQRGRAEPGGRSASAA